MTPPISVRRAALERDTRALLLRADRLADQLGASPQRTPEAVAALRPLFAEADRLQERAEKLATAMGEPTFFDRHERASDRELAMFLNPAYTAARSITQRIGLGEHGHREGTSSTLDARSGASLVRWEQARRGRDLPNVRMQGSIPQPAANLVAKRLGHVPEPLVVATDRLGDRAKLFSGKLTDVHGYMHLRGVHPRGWPDGATWDTVPGAGGDNGFAANPSRELKGRGHGSTSLALHEYGHVVDIAIATDPRWRTASASAEWRRGPWREHRVIKDDGQYTARFPEEWFAESFARFNRSQQSMAALARWYPQTYGFMVEHVGKPRFGG